MIYDLNKPNELAMRAMNKILNERYKIYKKDRDEGKDVVCGSEFEEATFSMLYATDKMKEELNIS